jgi:hypothetical protein
VGNLLLLPCTVSLRMTSRVSEACTEASERRRGKGEVVPEFERRDETGRVGVTAIDQAAIFERALGAILYLGPSFSDAATVVRWGQGHGEDMLQPSKPPDTPLEEE